MQIYLMVCLRYIPRPVPTVGMRTTNSHGPLHIDSHSGRSTRQSQEKRHTRLHSYMVTTATTTATSRTHSAAAAAWGYLRLQPRPPAPIRVLLHVTGGTCEAKREPERGHERQSDHENEAKRSRVRGLGAATHLRRRPGRRPVGCGGGGARPPTH